MTAEEYREEGIRLYEEDIEKALECFKKAAEGKDITAAVALAGYYYDEEGDPRQRDIRGEKRLRARLQGV